MAKDNTTMSKNPADHKPLPIEARVATAEGEAEFCGFLRILFEAIFADGPIQDEGSGWYIAKISLRQYAMKLGLLEAHCPYLSGYLQWLELAIHEKRGTASEWHFMPYNLIEEKLETLDVRESWAQYRVVHKQRAQKNRSQLKQKKVISDKVPVAEPAAANVLADATTPARVDASIEEMMVEALALAEAMQSERDEASALLQPLQEKVTDLEGQVAQLEAMLAAEQARPRFDAQFYAEKLAELKQK